MNRLSKWSGIGLSLLVSVGVLSSCSLVQENVDAGLETATQSCTVDLSPVSATSVIVPIGINERTPKTIPDDELAQLIDEAQQRAILAARSASSNNYWQPLADSWAIYEALLRALLTAPEQVATTDESQSIPTPFEFIEDVNVDFAAITKDTYCRIAFVKSDIPIIYPSNEQ
jgi:hypothetical protein